MIITLYGPDTYRRQKKLREIKSEYFEKKGNLAFEEIDAEEEGVFSQVLNFFRTPSLFQDTKLLVVKNAFFLLGDTRFKKALKEATDLHSFTLIISDEAKLIRKELSFLKTKPNLAQDFSYLTELKFASFLKEEMDLLDVVVEEDALRILAAEFSGDSWGAVEELKKLLLLKTKTISLAELKSRGVYTEHDFFFYISQWFRKPLPERLKNLEKLFAYGHDPAKIFNLLAYQDRGQLRRFADYDVQIKSGRLEYEEVLLELALI